STSGPIQSALIMANRPPIPPEVRRVLRKEVNFGCPVCRKPFLEFHHFDPPYEVEPHFNHEGMVALCPEHHRAASSWTKDKCRALKTSKNCQKPVKGPFDAWADNIEVLVRLGGNYSLGQSIPIAIGNENIVTLSKDSENGWLQLSFVLRDKHGDV